jgi:hypothetical protein
MDSVTNLRPAAYPDLKQVIDCLDEAIGLFTEGRSERACQCLANANSAFDSCMSEAEPEDGVTPIAIKGAFSRPVEREEAPLACAATA